MRKPPAPSAIIEEAADTGIYRTPRTVLYPIKTWAQLSAFKKRSQRENTLLYNPARLLVQARRDAKAVLKRLHDKAVKSPANAAQQEATARSLLQEIALLQATIRRGDIRATFAQFYRVGFGHMELLVRRKEHIAARERRVMAGRRLAHEQTHGTREEKLARWTDYQAQLNTLATQHPHWSLTALRQEVAKHFHVSFKTIERHTKAPQKLG